MTALEPELTAFDKRVLAALPVWGDTWPEMVTAWVVAERVGDDDVKLIRQVLDGLVRFGYATSEGLGRWKRWAAWQERVLPEAAA